MIRILFVSKEKEKGLTFLNRSNRKKSNKKYSQKDKNSNGNHKHSL